MNDVTEKLVQRMVFPLLPTGGWLQQCLVCLARALCAPISQHREHLVEIVMSERIIWIGC